jgi:hypothetical protein
MMSPQIAGTADLGIKLYAYCVDKAAMGLSADRRSSEGGPDP